MSPRQHFDLVNWWIDALPVQAAAFGRLAFYGKNGQETGYARSYERARGSEEASDDPFAIHLDKDPTLKELYAEAESVDGYKRDQNVFNDDKDIEDDVALIAKYDSGATMTYHLVSRSDVCLRGLLVDHIRSQTAYSPWEGCESAASHIRASI